MNYQIYSEIFKALGDETRIEILSLLGKNKMCACHILEKFHITQPTLSFHMKKLCDANLVICERIGKWTHYQINEAQLNNLNHFLTTITFKEGNYESN